MPVETTLPSTEVLPKRHATSVPTRCLPRTVTSEPPTEGPLVGASDISCASLRYSNRMPLAVKSTRLLLTSMGTALGMLIEPLPPW